jgi:3-oxoacyl-[acyl-carrier protein] reductase
VSVTDQLSLEGRVAIVTGAGAGLGRAEAFALGRAGAHVVLNDLPGGADEAAEEIRSLGGSASIVTGDVGERSTADALMEATVGALGRLDIVVNNAGVTRDRMLFNMSDDEWDLVMKIHLRGHFLISRNAASHWRGQFKETGEPVYGRLINTASEAFLSGSPGQANYAAAKAGITALTLSAARGMGQMGVRANAICPRARTAMTAGVFGEDSSGQEIDPLSPDHVAPLVAYLAAPASDRINGQVFVVYGGMVALIAAPVVEQQFDASGSTWDLADLDKQVGSYFADRDPAICFAADSVFKLTPAPNGQR